MWLGVFSNSPAKIVAEHCSQQVHTNVIQSSFSFFTRNVHPIYSLTEIVFDVCLGRRIAFNCHQCMLKNRGLSNNQN
jgi:hypothetical protein